MQEFKARQRVKVEFEGTVTGQSGSIVYVIAEAEGYEFEAPEKAVTLLDPADWPPQVGDIWEADGMEYFGRTVAGIVALIPENSRAIQEPEYFKALNPVLVRRRGQ